MLICPYSTCAAWMLAGCSVFWDFSVACLVIARNRRRKDGLPPDWHEPLPPLMENLGNWAVPVQEVQGIYRSSVNCIFLWTCHWKCCCEILEQVDWRGGWVSILRDAKNLPEQALGDCAPRGPERDQMTQVVSAKWFYLCLYLRGRKEKDGNWRQCESFSKTEALQINSDFKTGRTLLAWSLLLLVCVMW